MFLYHLLLIMQCDLISSFQTHLQEAFARITSKTQDKTLSSHYIILTMDVHKPVHVSAKYFSSLVMNGEVSDFQDFKIHLVTLRFFKHLQNNGLKIFCYRICLTFQYFLIPWETYLLIKIKTLADKSVSICIQKRDLKSGWFSNFVEIFLFQISSGGSGVERHISFRAEGIVNWICAKWPLVWSAADWGNSDELAIPGQLVSKLPFMPFPSDLCICVCPWQTVWEVCFSSILLCQSVVSDCVSNTVNTFVLLCSNCLWDQLKAFIALLFSKLS